ncbi:MAG TPA: sugar-binding protein [Bacillota bacterium]|nr:sugar-binding protein [Bacillota bacterium]
MRKTISIILVALMLCTVMSIMASANYGYTYTALKGTPVIDGSLDDIWNDANLKWTDVDHAYSADAKWDDATMRVKILWDEDNLYFLVAATAASEQGENFGSLAEFYISEGNTNAGGAYSAGDSQTCVRFVDGTFVLAGALKGGEGAGTNTKGAVSGCEAASWKDGSTYYIEVKLPFVTLTEDAAAGDDFGLEFMYNIMDSSSAFVNALRWNVDTANALGAGADAAPWQSTEPWGNLVLSATAATAPVAPETSDDGNESNPGTPETGDALVWIVLVGTVALAGAAVVIKKVR